MLGASFHSLALISSGWYIMSGVHTALCPLTPKSQDRIKKNPEAVAQPLPSTRISCNVGLKRCPPPNPVFSGSDLEPLVHLLSQFDHWFKRRSSALTWLRCHSGGKCYITHKRCSDRKHISAIPAGRSPAPGLRCALARGEGTFA